MRYSGATPGLTPDSDAYNLIVAACSGDQRAADTIGQRVKDWMPVAVYLAGYASIVFSKVNESDPQVMDMLADMLDAKHRMPA
jgi:hypothetical protein